MVINMYIYLLNQIKNAQMAEKASLKTPYSDLKLSILDLLAKNKFIDKVEVKGRKLNKRTIEVFLNKKGSDNRVVQDIQLVSRPSRRIYIGYKDIKPVKGGFGMLVLSTPKGVIRDKEAKKLKVGGEVLFKIW